MGGLVPAEMNDAHTIRALGLRVNLSDFEDLPATTRDDLIIFAECDSAKLEAEARRSRG
jgi:hypothetical protein